MSPTTGLSPTHISIINTTTTTTTATTIVTKDILPEELSIILDLLYVIVAILGILGNGLVLYMFASSKIKLKPFNLLLLNLSLSDMVSSLSLWPYVFVKLDTLREMSQKNADIACIFTIGQITYWLTTCAAIMTLGVISFSRYLFIRYPLKARYFRKKHAIAIIAITWPTAAANTAPNLFTYEFNAKYAVCGRKWPHGFNPQVYSSLTSLLGFILPAVVMIFTFVSIQRYFWNIGSAGVSTATRAIERRKKAARLLAALVIAFFACWSPFFVYWVLSRTATHIFADGYEGDYQRMRILRFVILVSLCNAVADPIIYVLKKDDFKRGFEALRGKMPYLGSRKRADADGTRRNEEDRDKNRVDLALT